MEPEEPPRKNYDFKERSFQRDNVVGPEAERLPTAEELAKMAGGPMPTGRGATGPKTDDPNDVFKVLQHNRAMAEKHRFNELIIRKVSSKRRRDFWLLLVPSDLLLGWLVWQARSNPVVLVYGLAGLVVVTLGLTWIMWFVMDDY